MNPKNLLLVGILAASFAARAANYYVNDASTNGDVFCSAVGALANSGTASNAPKASLNDVLATYVLAPGDTVFIDTGGYTNTSTPVIGPADSGSQVGGVVTVKGAGSAQILALAFSDKKSPSYPPRGGLHGFRHSSNSSPQPHKTFATH